MRTVYLGTSDFAVTVLERLASTEHRPVLVISRPDRPSGRGRKLHAPPVAESARALGIELDQPEDVNSDEARRRIAAAKPEAVLICAFGALLKEPLLSSHPMLNVHPSLLPRWRGAAPIARAIEAGDRVTGVSIMRPTAEMDAGPVCLQREEPIHPGDDYGSLWPRLATLGADLLIEALEAWPECVEQSDEGVTIAPKIEASDRRLDLSLAPLELERRVRALNPHVGTFVEMPDGGRLGVSAAAVPAGNDGGDRSAEPESPGPVARDHVTPEPAAPEPGRLAASGERLFYGCAGGALELLEVKPAGGRAMDAAAWLRGHGAALAGER